MRSVCLDAAFAVQLVGVAQIKQQFLQKLSATFRVFRGRNPFCLFGLRLCVVRVSAVYLGSLYGRGSATV
jgi:hypothetical protein